MRISDWSSDVCSSDLAGPGDGEAVESRRAAADLVENDQRAWPRLVQDGGGFHHLHHEGGASAGQVIRSADAGEQAVDDADMRRLRRHIAAHLGQHGDEGVRSEEHTSELQSLMRISYAVFCLKK